MREIYQNEGGMPNIQMPTMFDNKTQRTPSNRGTSPKRTGRSGSRGKENHDENNDPIEYQISPQKLDGIRKNVLSIKMRSDEGSPTSSYQTSPEKSLQNSKG